LISAEINTAADIHPDEHNHRSSLLSSAAGDGNMWIKTQPVLDLNLLAHTSGEWLRGSGPESDIVISSRMRLARNLAEFPFISRASKADRAEIESVLRARIMGLKATNSPDGNSPTANGSLEYLNVSELKGIDRQFLVERQLISREHAEAEGARGVAIDPHEQVSLMINEEDHLRIQVMHSGLDLQNAWQQINDIDSKLSEHVTFAFHQKLGFLTACPTNVGTGLRVSVMLHLPALVITRQIDKVFRSLQKISLAVRGLYGEGSQAMGDFYQISNQITLGKSEAELVKQVGDVVPVLIDYERRARDFLIRESQENLHDRVSRAYGILRNAQTISSEETMHLLSSVRMGVNLGLISDLPIPTLNELFIHTQPAHLQKLRGGELDTADRNIERARYLRAHLNKEGEPGTKN
jgi:protein arginine kinase